MNKKTSEDELPSLAPISMAGNFVENVTIAPRSLSTMVLATGRDEDRNIPVLLPFVDTVIHGITQGDIARHGNIPDELEPIFAKTLPLENAIWLAFDLLRDIRMASEQLMGAAGGNTEIEPTRLEHARRFAELAYEEARLCEEVFSRSSTPKKPENSRKNPT